MKMMQSKFKKEIEQKIDKEKDKNHENDKKMV